eukprot:988623-Pyramimonas_sp.AAC.1
MGCSPPEWRCASPLHNEKAVQARGGAAGRLRPRCCREGRLRPRCRNHPRFVVDPPRQAISDLPRGRTLRNI